MGLYWEYDKNVMGMMGFRKKLNVFVIKNFEMIVFKNGIKDKKIIIIK